MLQTMACSTALRFGWQDPKRIQPEGFDNLVMAMHYSCLLGRCRERGGKECVEIASKIAITLLRYSDIIPADKCFYQVSMTITFSVSPRLLVSVEYGDHSFNYAYVQG